LRSCGFPSTQSRQVTAHHCPARAAERRECAGCRLGDGRLARCATGSSARLESNAIR
jgi:hypothetical protein